MTILEPAPSPKSLRSRLIEWGVVAIIIGGMAALILPVVQSARNPQGPFGEMLPADPPVEANRVTHTLGMSIIAPKNWDQVRSGEGQPMLQIAARGTPGRRLTSTISIEPREVPTASELNGCTPRRFQDFPAFERFQVNREGSWDDPALSSYELWIDQGGKWWLVMFSIADSPKEIPREIKQYIDTIRFPQRTRKLAPQSNTP